MSADVPVKPEFSRLVAVEDIDSGLERTISARPEELKALARRMKLPAIRLLSATLRVSPEGRGGYMVRGHLRAEVEQECVRTLEIFPATVEADIERLFVPPDSPAARALDAAPTVELDTDAPDAPDIISEGHIDLGELVAEYLALALDPWPKKPGTDFMDMEAAAPETARREEPDEEHPFAALRQLKKEDRS